MEIKKVIYSYSQLLFLTSERKYLTIHELIVA